MSIQSAGGIIYHKDAGQILFLIIKRQSLSKKIERVAPKGKIRLGEKAGDAALREIVEETGLLHHKLYLEKALGSVVFEYGDQKVQKKVEYFLIEYLGQMSDISLQDTEGFLGIHKRATIQETLNLVTFYDLRLLYKKAFDMLIHGSL